MAKDLKRLQRNLRAFAMTLPGAFEDHPWGETVAKVGKKVFVFGLSSEGKPVKEGGKEYPPGISVKLAPSHVAVSKKKYAEPTGYGLGKSGWVSLRFDLADVPTEQELEKWITESYCLVAPKSLARQVLGDSVAPAKPKKSKGKPKPSR